MANKRIDEATGTETVGHEWDGIEELNNPLPRWWLYTMYATILWALVYVVLYPAIPLLSKGTEGTQGWTSRGQLADEMKAENDKRAGMLAALAATPIEKLAENKELMQRMAGAVQNSAMAMGVPGGTIPRATGGLRGTRPYSSDPSSRDIGISIFSLAIR